MKDLKYMWSIVWPPTMLYFGLAITFMFLPFIGIPMAIVGGIYTYKFLNGEEK